MKKTAFLTGLIVSFAAELILCSVMVGRMETVSQDPVSVNECVHTVAGQLDGGTAYDGPLDYSVIDERGGLVCRSSDKAAANVSEAVRNNDIILGLEIPDKEGFKIIIRNTTADRLADYRRGLITSIGVVSLLQALVIAAYFLYLKKTVTDPFDRLNSFAARVAEGNLDIPLTRDRQNVFGDFTEAFDIMRTELKKARAAEKKAYDDRNEMVAKLSHDIKTPIASIKSTSEIGYELTAEERTKELFNSIDLKSDQITTLVDNLFNSTLDDITGISVTPYEYGSDILPGLIFNADYLHRTAADRTMEDDRHSSEGMAYGIPECRIYADRLRLQQTFDNIFMNSYKYAGTDISVEAFIEEGYLVIAISDSGPGVGEDELPLLMKKYKRGSNATGRDGAGLGLFLSDYYLKNMGGRLVLKNAYPGLTAMVYLRTI